MADTGGGMDRSAGNQLVQLVDRLLAKRPVPGSVPLAVSGLIAAICLVDALAIALAGGGAALVALCALGYPLTRLFQKSIPGT